MRQLAARCCLLAFGIVAMAAGIVLITKTGLGTSPISSIPYVLDIGFAPTLGMFTLVFNLLLVALQLGILRRRFPRHFWLEIPVTLGFSCFIDLTMSMLTAYSPQGYPLQLLSLLFGCLVLGFGVFMEMAAGVVMLPGECTVSAISTTWHTDFGRTKVAVDVTMAVTAAVLGLLLYHRLAGVREGTILSALLVGMIARTFHSRLNGGIQRILERRDGSGVSEGQAA